MLPYHAMPVGRESECCDLGLLTITNKSYRLKCNREQPCQNCTTRGEQSTCKWRGFRNGATTAPAIDPMQQRIDKLESLVKSLVAQTLQSDFLNSPEGSDISEHHINSNDVGDATVVGKYDGNSSFNTGITVVNGSRSVYRASDNWADVLQEVKNPYPSS